MHELGADYAGQANVTATLAVWDNDPRVASEKLRLVEKLIQGRYFTAMPEMINAADAWLGSLPGHVYANVRQPPISTINLARKISDIWGAARHSGAGFSSNHATYNYASFSVEGQRGKARPHHAHT